MIKILKILNTIAIGIPIVLAFGGIFDEAMLMFALVSTMVTGFIQVVIGIIFWIKKTQNPFIVSYLIGVILFFIGIKFTTIGLLWIMPPLLCMYFSVIIYAEKEKNEY